MSVITELQDIFEQNNGVLRAEDVVEFAKNPATELHSKFTWEDTEAARLWRLHQADRIIRVSIDMEENTPKELSVLVDLVWDRAISSETPGKSYRNSAELYHASDRYRQTLIRRAIREARTWRDKYNNVTELSPIFDAIEQVEESATSPDSSAPVRSVDGATEEAEREQQQCAGPNGRTEVV